jgi:predicted nucleic acid-binding protein
VIYLLDTNAIIDLMRAAPRIEGWIASLATVDRVITCTIVRGEILFGIARLPTGKRRTELEETSLQFLNAFRCEPIPERAADFYADLKLARQKRSQSRLKD